MRAIFGVLAAVAVISGIVSAFAFSQLTGQAGAAPPPPQPQPVSVVSPVDSRGNVRVSGSGRAIPIAENVSLAASGSLDTSFVDTADCGRLLGFVNGVSGSVRITMLVSADGVAVNAEAEGFESSSAANRVVSFSMYTTAAYEPAVAPKAALRLVNNSSVEAAGVQKAWLFCSQ